MIWHRIALAVCLLADSYFAVTAGPMFIKVFFGALALLTLYVLVSLSDDDVKITPD